jgi:hypothetical protein
MEKMMIFRTNHTLKCPQCSGIGVTVQGNQVTCNNCGERWVNGAPVDIIGTTVWVVNYPISIFNGQKGTIEAINGTNPHCPVRVSFPAAGKNKYIDMFHPAYLSTTPPTPPKEEEQTPKPKSGKDYGSEW